MPLVVVQLLQRQKGCDVLNIKQYDIRERRLELGLTQIDVAIAVGVSPEAFRNWERGASTPKDENMVKLKEVLKIDFE